MSRSPANVTDARRTLTFNGGDGFALDAAHCQVNGYPVVFDWTHEGGDDAIGPMAAFYTVKLRQQRCTTRSRTACAKG